MPGEVSTQDGHQFGGDGDDADRPAGPVLQAPALVAAAAVCPVLADDGLGLVQLQAAPADVRQHAVLGAERHGFGRAEHGEVQPGEERDQPFAPGRNTAAPAGPVSGPGRLTLADRDEGRRRSQRRVPGV
jgi:hypothetical protein